MDGWMEGHGFVEATSNRMTASKKHAHALMHVVRICIRLDGMEQLSLGKTEKVVLASSRIFHVIPCQ